MRLLKLPFPFFLLVLYYVPCSAQADSMARLKDISLVHSSYQHSLGAASSLYTGKVFERYWTGIKGHPFFLGDQFVMGSVNYQGVDYRDIPLMYDMSRDQLITQNFSGELSMELLREKISRFSIGPHQFVNIMADSGNAMPAGFYEVLYNGSMQVLARRTNRVVRITQREDEPGKISADKQFTEYDDYYVMKNGQYFNIGSESELVNLLKDHRADVRKFLNRRPAGYRKDPAAAIVETVTYYEQLKN